MRRSFGTISRRISSRFAVRSIGQVSETPVSRPPGCCDALDEPGRDWVSSGGEYDGDLRWPA